MLNVGGKERVCFCSIFIDRFRSDVQLKGVSICQNWVCLVYFILYWFVILCYRISCMNLCFVKLNCMIVGNKGILLVQNVLYRCTGLGMCLRCIALDSKIRIRNK